MAVGLRELPPLNPVAGVKLGTARAGIKRPGRRDLVVLELGEEAACAAVFTRNAFCAAPVIVARRHLGKTSPRYLLINTGNANAGTGEKGVRDALSCCEAFAKLAGVETESILPFSTGVIGEPLPVSIIQAALPAAFATLSESAWLEAAEGIMTTDTMPKGSTRQVNIDGALITITGMAKGAGMIRPDMATMLAFIATDAAVEPSLLQRCLTENMQFTFNAITVDGDTSTNDACVLIATGRAMEKPITDYDEPRYAKFSEAVLEVCSELAQAIVRDAEGATKFITIVVEGGSQDEECRQVAYAIAHSPLVKTAFFACDPNWGRILAAVGRAGVAELAINHIDVYLDEICIVRGGARAPEYLESQGKEVMSRDEITIRVDLGRGTRVAKIWTCDLSYDYVRINAEYRT